MHLIIPLPPCTQSQSFVGHTRKVFYDWYYSRLDPVIHASDHAAVNGKQKLMKSQTLDLPSTRCAAVDRAANALHFDEQDACMFLNLRFSDPDAEVAVRQLTTAEEEEENDEVQSFSPPLHR